MTRFTVGIWPGIAALASVAVPLGSVTASATLRAQAIRRTSVAQLACPTGTHLVQHTSNTLRAAADDPLFQTVDVVTYECSSTWYVKAEVGSRWGSPYRFSNPKYSRGRDDVHAVKFVGDYSRTSQNMLVQTDQGANTSVYNLMAVSASAIISMITVPIDSNTLLSGGGADHGTGFTCEDVMSLDGSQALWITQDSWTLADGKQQPTAKDQEPMTYWNIRQTSATTFKFVDTLTGKEPYEIASLEGLEAC